MKACREKRRKIRASHILRCDDQANERKSVIPRFREKPLGSPSGARTKTDTGGQVENTKAIGRTMVKELGIMTP